MGAGIGVGVGTGAGTVLGRVAKKRIAAITSTAAIEVPATIGVLDFVSTGAAVPDGGCGAGSCTGTVAWTGASDGFLGVT